jgi:muramoyltetrapeptide carboxypeptidase
LRGAQELERALDNARSLGWEPEPGDHVLARAGYFAGTDAERLRDLNRAIAADGVDGIWFARGGYGALRLIEHVDYAALRRRPKVLIGYSDITALHAAIGVRAELVTFHGPTARAPLSPFSRDSLERAVVRGENPCGGAPGARVIRTGRARGPLVGGNLALLAALAGTPFAPRMDGAVLVIEDVSEAVYRIDRMLQQLRLSGMLRGCRGIVAGHFTDRPETSVDGERPLDEVLLETAETLDVPCIAGAPIGHIDEQWTVPLGREAEMVAEEGSVIVSVG